MKRIHAVVALAIVASLCVALPAVGAAPSPLKLAKKALKIGKKADKRARKAARTANRALKTGRAADARARQALGTLAGTVPSAAHAQSAGRAQSAAVADSLQGIRIARFNTRVAPSASAASLSAARTAAARVPLVSEGPLTIYGKCFVDTSTAGNPAVEGEIFVETAIDGVVYDGGSGDSSNGFIGPTTVENDRTVLQQSSQAGVGNPGTLNVTDAQDSDFYAIAPGGTAIQGQLGLGTKVNNPPAGDGVFGAGSACIFSGFATAG